MKPFDLNMEEVLENWEPFHAIREIIANALDEQLMSDTKEIAIEESQDGSGWHIRDFGRGIEIEHFTQNENPEKFDGPAGIIGKFGVGLKDALATFHRHGISPVISSRHGTYRITMHPKEGFEDIQTLHVMFDDEPNDMDGTDFFLEGATEEQIEDAKDLFLKFSGIEVLEDTKYGSVLAPVHEGPDDRKINWNTNRVYINGVLASEEENFLFSYNITNLTKAMRKALNRERTNVGRTTYTDRVKSILKASKSNSVMSELADQIRQRASGEQRDEILWAEIAQIGIQALADLDNMVIFVTEEESLNNPDEMERMRLEGYTVIVTNDRDRNKIDGGNATTFGDYVADWNDSFEFEFVEEKDLKKKEKEIFKKTQQILELVGWTKDSIPQVRISETLQKEQDSSSGFLRTFDAVGVWQPLMGIIIHRGQLKSLAAYASTLLHEAAHASSGASDATRVFESELTDYLGQTAEGAIDG